MSKKASFFSVLLLLISIPCFSQNTFVPDDNFEQALIDLGYDSGPLDDYVLTTNITGVTDLNVEGKNISDLTGIEDFVTLSVLESTNNLLTNIDISNNLNLTQLFVDNNQLTNLDVKNNSLLQILWCDNNQLSTIDVSQNPELISLTCGNNLISVLDVSLNTKLNVLVCDNNQISNLNLNNNATLNRLQCSGNLLTSLNTLQNISLSILYCFDNEIPDLDLSLNDDLIEINCSNNLLTSLDFSNNSKLTYINCSNNDLCSLDVKNGNNINLVTLDFTFNPDLNCVIVDAPNQYHSSWMPSVFANYVGSSDDCKNLILIDEINDFVGSSFTLPTLTNGIYYTESNAGGQQLLPGEIITTSQTIYIFNSTQCYTNESSFNVLITSGDYYIPKYFTPNNDNNHDTWRVVDNIGVFTSINIYNRYGKLLKSLPPNSFEWDGTFKGELMHTDDYWFVIYRNNAQPLKGHFTLKR